VKVSWSSGFKGSLVSGAGWEFGKSALVERIPLSARVVKSAMDLSQAEDDRMALGPQPALMALAMLW
jgi:hypothetical protein